MGQNDSKQIQQNIALLELENAIQHAQAQKFLHDYHTNDPAVEDVKAFDQNKLKMFLKYFILEKYAGRSIQKQNTKRTKTHQSGAPNQDRTYSNLTALLCFEIYRIDENLTKVYQLITAFLLTSTQSSFNQACQQILKILGVKQCSIIVLNKSNVQQIKISFSQQKTLLTIKQKGLQQSPYPRSQKYRFRKLQKSQLIKQKIILDPSELSSDVFYVEQLPTKERSSVLVMSFQDLKTIENFGEKADSKNIVEKYVSSIGQFLMKMASLSHFSQISENQSHQSQSKSSSCNYSEEGQYQIAQICWNFLKIYKTGFDFEHSLLVQKIKKQHKALLEPNTIDVSFRQIKLQLMEKINNEDNQSETDGQIVDFLNQYEKKHLSARNQISEYLQKYFQAISKDLLEFEFDSNTELKVFVCSRQTKENQSIFNILRKIIDKGNKPTLLDIFKDFKAFREFYKISYQQALKQQDEQKTFEHEGVILQFKFLEQTIQNIKISVQFESLAEKYRKSVVSSPRNSRKTTQKKKFTEFHNEGNIEDTNKENALPAKKIENKEAEMIRISIRTSSNKNLKILDLTAQVDAFSGNFDIYEPSLDILKIQKPLQFKLAYEIVHETPFYKFRHPQFSEKLINFLEQLKQGYQQNNNPFHNFTHGVNVMHTAFLLTNIPNINQFLSDFTKFTLVISALCHDVGHTGFNNAFEIAKRSYLAELFNDISPLQNYHISRTLAILKHEECDFLDFLTKEEKVKFRKLLISNILNTDMKEHFNVLKKYEQKKNIFKKDDLQDEKVLCGMLIHSSDFGASTKQFEVCKAWSHLVNKQFMNQSRMEAELGIPLSPFMLNLENELVMAKNELGFLKFMVQPLYKSLSQSFGGEMISGEMFRNVNKNIESWENIIKELTK